MCSCSPNYRCDVCGGCYVHDHERVSFWSEDMGEAVRWFWYSVRPWMRWRNNGCFHHAWCQPNKEG